MSGDAGAGAGTRSPAAALALVPLALVPCCWLWWWASTGQPGVQVGRSADLLLVCGAAVSAWLLSRRQAMPQPALPLLLALAWQAVALTLWAPVREPGLIWLVERAAALAAAVGLGAWLMPTAEDAPDRRGPALAGAAIAGLGLLALTCLGGWHGIGIAMAIGQDPPFGNVNFNAGAALPLLCLGLAGQPLRGWRWTAYATAGLAMSALLALGALDADRCWAVVVVLGSAACAWLILRLPPRWHLPCFGAAVALAITGWTLATAGVLDAAWLGAGSAQRPWIWRSALEAVAGPHLAIGYGPGAAIAVLVEQPAFAASWLTVPSYAEHAHCEPLQVLLDGGLPLAGLLGWSLWGTLRCLWRRRHERLPAALLVAWSAAGAHALIESHLSQPGGLLMLAILAGVSWAWARPLPTALPAVAVGGPALAAMALAALAAAELAGNTGSPVELQRRYDRSIDERSDPAVALAAHDRLRGRLGPLTDLDYQRAMSLGRLGRHADAATALAAQLRRLPVHVPSLALAARMRRAGRTTPALAAAEAAARTRAAALLNTVHATAQNHAILEALRRELDRDRHDGQAPAQ